MHFTSLDFFVFLAVVVAGIMLLRRQEHKIAWLFVAGAFFYGYWDWRFLALIGFTSLFDYWLGLALGTVRQPWKKWLLALDVTVNLGILCIFKYLNFFIDSFNHVLSPAGVHFDPLNILLPVGISFFVFEAMSYCIDVYRGHLKPYDNWLHFALFIFFFPRMIAGPIIRPAQFLPQLARPILITWPNVVIGGQMFLLGLAKKIVIADHLAGFVDFVFADPANCSGIVVWQAVIAYAIQIFCDFSGYTDMALGTAKILGFDLPANFDMPYLARSLTEFWRRWHISLSSWLRDYLYIPLGGNRHGGVRTYLNLLATMTLGGLWHGASWNFVTWGLLHGAGLTVQKAATPLWSRLGHWGQGWVVTVACWVATFSYVCFCWIFFRAQSFHAALVCLEKMSGAALGGLVWISGPLAVAVPALIVGHVIGVWMHRRGITALVPPLNIGALALLFTWVLGIFFLAATQAAPFIYFQF